MVIGPAQPPKLIVLTMHALQRMRERGAHEEDVAEEEHRFVVITVYTFYF